MFAPVWGATPLAAPFVVGASGINRKDKQSPARSPAAALNTPG